MVVHSCEICNYSTTYKWIYTNHLKSKKHLELQDNTSGVFYHECVNCSKKYKSRSGLHKHNQKCKKEETTVPVNLTTNAELINHINEIKNELKNELRDVISNLQPSINNTTNNNNTNHNNIHIYLNTHCNNAMNIDQFINSMKLVKDDFNEIDKNRYYYQGATKILKKYFAKLSLEERPMHRATPVSNRPDLYFVRDENSWKQECQSMINYQIKYIEEFESEDEQLAMTRFFEKFNDKLYDTYKELCTSDKKMERIHDKMAVSGYSQSRIDMLDELTSSNLIVLDPPVNHVGKGHTERVASSLLTSKVAEPPEKFVDLSSERLQS